MNKKLLIFGAGKIAEVVSYYATKECGHQLAAFVTDDNYRHTDNLFGIPVVNFSTLTETHPPEAYDVFVAIGYHNLNRLREQKCNEVKSKGYRLVSVICPSAAVPDNVVVGENVFIMPPAVIHPFVTLGDNVFVWSGAMVGHHSHIGDHVWITSAANISGNVTIGRNTFIAVNATVGHSVRVGASCFLGANSLVTKDLEEKKVVIAEQSKPIRLDSDQFLRMSSFSNL